MKRTRRDSFTAGWLAGIPDGLPSSQRNIWKCLEIKSSSRTLKIRLNELGNADALAAKLCKSRQLARRALVHEHEQDEQHDEHHSLEQRIPFSIFGFRIRMASKCEQRSKTFQPLPSHACLFGALHRIRRRLVQKKKTSWSVTDGFGSEWLQKLNNVPTTFNNLLHKHGFFQSAAINSKKTRAKQSN